MNLSRDLSEWGFLLGCLHLGAMAEVVGLWAERPVDAHRVAGGIVVSIGMTAVLAYSLAVHARESGYSRVWCAMALLGLIGVLVVHFLPDRSGGHVPGFPVLPYTAGANDDHGQTVRPAAGPGRDG